MLKYAFALVELACVYLQQVLIKEPHLIKDPNVLFNKLFRVFIVCDKKDAHPIVEEFLQALYQ